MSDIVEQDASSKFLLEAKAVLESSGFFKDNSINVAAKMLATLINEDFGDFSASELDHIKKHGLWNDHPTVVMGILLLRMASANNNFSISGVEKVVEFINNETDHTSDDMRRVLTFCDHMIRQNSNEQSI